MTKCIAIDTSTKRFCLGAKNSSDYFDLSIEQSTDHAKEIFKRIDDVLKLASVSLKELDFPVSYTHLTMPTTPYV